MYAFDLYIIGLKISLTVQFILIMMKLHSDTSMIYLASDMLFKISIGLFLIFFFILNKVTEINIYDKTVITLAGIVLIYDAIYFNLSKILSLYNIQFNPYTFLQNLT